MLATGEKKKLKKKNEKVKKAIASIVTLVSEELFSLWLSLPLSLPLSVVLSRPFDTAIAMLRRLASTAARTALAAEARASAPIRSSFGATDGEAAAAAACRSSSSSTSSSSSSSTSFSSLPVIDVDALLSDSSTREERLAAAEKLHRACKEVGFFYARARGTTDSSASGALLARARRWFEQTPLEQKREIALSAATGFRGWQPLHANVTRFEEAGGGNGGEQSSSKKGGGYVGDHHEAIDLYKGFTSLSSFLSPSLSGPCSPFLALHLRVTRVPFRRLISRKK